MEVEVFTLPLMENFICFPGDSTRLTTIVGVRKNLHHSGSSSGMSPQECMKSILKDVPFVPMMQKYDMLQT